MLTNGQCKCPAAGCTGLDILLYKVIIKLANLQKFKIESEVVHPVG